MIRIAISTYQSTDIFARPRYRYRRMRIIDGTGAVIVADQATQKTVTGNTRTAYTKIGNGRVDQDTVKRYGGGEESEHGQHAVRAIESQARYCIASPVKTACEIRNIKSCTQTNISGQPEIQGGIAFGKAQHILQALLVADIVITTGTDR